MWKSADLPADCEYLLTPRWDLLQHIREGEKSVYCRRRLTFVNIWWWTLTAKSELCDVFIPGQPESLSELFDVSKGGWGCVSRGTWEVRQLPGTAVSGGWEMSRYELISARSQRLHPADSAGIWDTECFVQLVSNTQAWTVCSGKQQRTIWTKWQEEKLRWSLWAHTEDIMYSKSQFTQHESQWDKHAVHTVQQRSRLVIQIRLFQCMYS